MSTLATAWMLGCAGSRLTKAEMLHHPHLIMTDCIGVRGTCRQCGSPVLSYLCNADFIAVRPEAGSDDYWCCCSNVICSNHRGEGYSQFDPDWIEREAER